MKSADRNQPRQPLIMACTPFATVQCALYLSAVCVGVIFPSKTQRSYLPLTFSEILPAMARVVYSNHVINGRGRMIV